MSTSKIVGRVGSVNTAGGYTGNIKNYTKSMNTYLGGRLFNNRIDQNGQIYDNIYSKYSLLLDL